MGLQYFLRHLGKLWISFLIGIYQSIRCHVRNSHALGLDRGNKQGADYPVTVENTRIRHEMEKPWHYEKLNKLSSFVASQIKEYTDNGFEVIAIIGANRSPNCGVDTTSDCNIESEGMGLFMNKLHSELEEQNIKIPFVGLKSSDDINAKFNRILK